MTQTPKHVAIIMDGNGRWASKKSPCACEGVRRLISWGVRGESAISLLTDFVRGNKPSSTDDYNDANT